ncbi:MAG: DUF899 family protein [Actinomycetota bacterium]
MSDAREFQRSLDELRAAERDLMLQRERVAEQRRALPVAGVGEDYEFEELVAGAVRPVRLSELFTAPDRTLIVYHFMYGKRQESPCPMCSAWADGWNAVSGQLARRVDLVIAVAAPIDDWSKVVERRGWTELRHVSAAPSSFKVDVGGEDADGNQSPFISTWTLDADGRPRQRYGGAARYDDEHWRGLDLLSPIWHLLDLCPEGRGDFMPVT